MLKTLPRLGALSLDSAGVTDAGVEALNAMTGLKSVNLYHTLVSSNGMAALKQPASSIGDRVGPRFLASRPPEGLGEMRPALLMIAAATLIPGAEPSWVSDAGGLVTRDSRGRTAGVDLRSSWVTDSDLHELAELPDLTTLNLSLARITDRGMKELKNAPGIVDLDLQYAEQVTDDGISAIRGWKRLRQLNLRGTT